MSAEPDVDTETILALNGTIEAAVKAFAGGEGEAWKGGRLPECAERELAQILMVCKVGLANALNLPVP